MFENQFGKRTIEEDIILKLDICTNFFRKIGGGKGSQRRALNILRKKAPMTQRELLDIMGIRSSTLSEILGKLETNGYIQRTRSRADKRNVDIELTEEGLEESILVQTDYRRNAPKYFSHMTAKEKETLLYLLEKLESGVTGEITEKNKE